MAEPTVQDAITCFYRTVLSFGKELFTQVIWSANQVSGTFLSITVLYGISPSKPHAHLLRKKKGRRSFADLLPAIPPSASTGIPLSPPTSQGPSRARPSTSPWSPTLSSRCCWATCAGDSSSISGRRTRSRHFRCIQCHRKFLISYARRVGVERYACLERVLHCRAFSTSQGSSHGRNEVIKTHYIGLASVDTIENDLFPMLEELELMDLPVLEELPDLGSLPCLKSLRMRMMSMLKHIDFAFSGATEKVLLPRVETLVLRELKALEELPRCNELMRMSLKRFENFTSLKELQIKACPKLSLIQEEETGLLPPSLKTLKLDDSGDLDKLLLGNLYNLTSLTKLEIVKCPHVQSIPRELFLRLSLLERLTITDGHELRLVEGLEASSRASVISTAECLAGIGDSSGEGEWPCEGPAGDWPCEGPVGDWPREGPAGDGPREGPGGDWPCEGSAGDCPGEGPAGDWPCEGPA
ncbi:hypothetical protein ZIOFF_074052 [Zingiber officinale]|uniref:Disease resistance protein n=1 Tax=Zingiber officinale TaxID=94328 RepID=A0A8J5BXG2_ZINOF|nr:hypothetical protein ZIOFF_074052 [Zingiber officinale]